MLKKILLLLAMVVTTLPSKVCADELLYKSDELIVRFATKSHGQQLSLSERNNTLAERTVGTVKHSYRLVPGLSVVKLVHNRTVPDGPTNSQQRICEFPPLSATPFLCIELGHCEQVEGPSLAGQSRCPNRK
jgi:hypothetical protein